MLRGTVRLWDDKGGWGVIDAPEAPGGSWTHFSVLQMDGFRRLRPGQQVLFDTAAADQDGFAFQTQLVMLTEGARPDGATEQDPAYGSSLTINFDE